MTSGGGGDQGSNTIPIIDVSVSSFLYVYCLSVGDRTDTRWEAMTET